MRLRTRIWLLLSQAVNALWLKGDPDESLCARAYREGWGHKLDRWLGKGHCREVWRSQQIRQAARSKNRSVDA